MAFYPYLCSNIKHDDMRINLQLLILLVVVLLSSPMATAQQFVYNDIPTHDLIPVAAVRQVLHDSEGFVWYGTYDGGLCRDDGYRIDVFRSDYRHPALIGRSNTVTSIAEMPGGRIFFTTNYGVYYVDKSDYSVHPLDPDGLKGTAQCVFCDSHGDLWLGRYGHVLRYNSQLEQVGNYPTAQGRGWETVSMFAEDDRHRVWAIGWNGQLLRFDSDKNVLRHVATLKDTNGFALEWDSDNRCLWVGTWSQGVQRWDDTNQCFIPQSATLTEELQNRILSIRHDRRRHIIWVVSGKTLAAYSTAADGSLRRVDAVNEILPASVLYADKLSFDSSGNLWVACSSTRSFVISSPYSNVERHSLSTLNWGELKYFTAYHSSEDKDYVWIYDNRDGVRAFRKNGNNGNETHQSSAHWSVDGGGTSVISLSDASQLARLNGNMTACHIPSADGHEAGIWIGSGALLVHAWMDADAKPHWQTVANVPDHMLSTIYDDPRTQTVYVGGTHMYALPYSNITDTVVMLRPLADDEIGTVIDIDVTPRGDIYAATKQNGLVRYRKEAGRYTCTTVCPYTDIQAFCIAHDGRIYMAGSDGRVMCYDMHSKDVTDVPLAGNSNGDAIKDITIDRLGHLWIVSELYFKEYNPQTQAYRVMRGSDHAIDMPFFNTICSDNSGNQISICGAKGLLCVKPSEELNHQSAKVKPRVSAISLDDSLLLVTSGMKNVDIAHDCANAVFHFTTLEHLHAENVMYQYRLKGYDKDWVTLPAGIHSANYVNLPKGHYTLQLRATDIYGCWGETTDVLSVHRLPAWWDTWWAYMLYALAVIGVFVIGIRMYLERQKEHQQARMERELTELKFRFFTNISHEIRTPLTLIITPLESLLSTLTGKAEPDGEFAQKSARLLPGIYNNARELKDLISRLLDFRKLEMGRQRLFLSSGDASDFLRSACEAFRPVTSQRGIALGCTVPDTPMYMLFDKDKLHHIVYNLLSNAVKFTPDGGSINVTGTASAGILTISIRDTGCGISREAQQHIFDRFYQVHHADDSSSTGTGIGLHMAKEFANMMRGDISVSSEEGHGTEFIITLPVRKAEIVADGTQGVATTDDSAETTSADGQSPADANGTAHNDERPTLLLVDDTREFRDFLEMELADTYNIYTAQNGQEAMDVLTQHSEVDMVLTDVMMPVMDGLALCQHIKRDVNHSHIMVMLLTAKSAEESKLEGYKAGADAYIAKPFNMELLSVRIRHLLDQRQARYQAYQQSTEPAVTEVTTNTVDQKFMQQMIDHVKAHLDDSEYGPQELCGDMCMSRSTLYRKIQSLTGEKPTEFVRNIRLKQAAILIQQGKHTITEISYMTGFSSQSYFSRCFKDYFGVSATAYNNREQ